MVVLGSLVVVIVAVNVTVALGKISFTEHYIKGVAHDKYPFN